MTREEAIHELQEDKRMYETDVCHAGDGSPDGRLLEALDMAIEALSAEAKWIPCSEKLPSNDGCVLVTIDDGIEFGKYENGEWSIWVCEHWDKWDAKGTIAWMPLPEPWKGEENG